MKKQVVEAATTAIETKVKTRCDKYFTKTTKVAIEQSQKSATNDVQKVHKEKLD